MEFMSKSSVEARLEQDEFMVFCKVDACQSCEGLGWENRRRCDKCKGTGFDWEPCPDIVLVGKG